MGEKQFSPMTYRMTCAPLSLLFIETSNINFLMIVSLKAKKAKSTRRAVPRVLFSIL